MSVNGSKQAISRTMGLTKEVRITRNIRVPVVPLNISSTTILSSGQKEH